MPARLLSLLLIGVFLLPARVTAAYDQKLTREFSQRLAMIAVENPDGITEVQTWLEPTVRVIASRANGDGPALDSEVFFRAPAPDHLRIDVRLRDARNPIRLNLYVPASIHLAVRSVRGSVTVMGALAGVSVQSRGANEAESQPSSSSSSNGIRLGEDVLKLEARLVNLNVYITDVNGKTLPSLKKEDFIVYEDNVKQDVSYFEPVNAPLNIILLLDLSGSTEHKIKVMKKAAQKFVDSLNPSDRIAVAGFTRRFFIISNFTTDHHLLKDRIGDIKNRHSGTAYYDAMWSALDLLDEANATRKSIVVLTDGVDNSLDHPDDSEFDPKHSFAEILARIEEADATIYPIYLDTEYETLGSRGRNGHEAYVTARSQLQALAEQTGAVMFKAERAEDLEGVYQQVASELHSLYSLAYAPKLVRTDGKWRRIGIAVSLPGAKVRTKRGYYAK